MADVLHDFPLLRQPVWLRGVQEDGQRGTLHFFKDFRKGLKFRELAQLLEQNLRH